MQQFILHMYFWTDATLDRDRPRDLEMFRPYEVFKREVDVIIIIKYWLPQSAHLGRTLGLNISTIKASFGVSLKQPDSYTYLLFVLVFI
jgi:hypothetical protein